MTDLRHRLRPVLLLFCISLGCNAAELHAHRLVRLEDGRVWGWGSNTWGQIDAALNAVVPSPMELPGPSGVTQVTAGARHSLAIVDGTVWAWGDNTAGQLGVPANKSASGKARVPLPKRAIGIAAGAQHSLALLEDGSVWAWGANQRGQLGQAGTGAFAVGHAPALVGGLPPSVVSVAGGADFSVALLANGNVWLWGSGSRAPTEVALPVPAVAIKAQRAAAILRDRTNKHWLVTPPSLQLADASESDFESLEPLPVPQVTVVGRLPRRASGKASVSGSGQCAPLKRDSQFTCTVPFGWSGVVAFRPAGGGVERRQVAQVTGTIEVNFADSVVAAREAAPVPTSSAAAAPSVAPAQEVPVQAVAVAPAAPSPSVVSAPAAPPVPAPAPAPAPVQVAAVAAPAPPAQLTIAGKITLGSDSGARGLADVALAGNGAQCTRTDAAGQFTCTVANGWSGSLAPARANYRFSPSALTYRDLRTPARQQDFAATFDPR